MNNLAIVFKLAKKDIINPKYYRRLVLCFFIILVHYILFMNRQMEYAFELNLHINVLEPMVVLLSKNLGSVLLMGALVFLLNDAPFRDKGDYYTVYRVGRTRWLSAKIVAMAFFIVLYILAAFLASLFFSLQRVEFSLFWSEFSQLPVISSINGTKVLHLGTIPENFALIEAAFAVSLLYFVWALALGMIIVNSNLKYHRTIGIILAFVPVVADTIISSLIVGHNGFLRYLSLDNLGKGDLLPSIAVMLLITFALIVLAIIQVGSHSMHEKE